MIPILYNRTETEFNTNGIGRLIDCIKCTVTEERNGVYECEFEYPVSGKYYSEIQEGRIIAVTHDENGDIQPFDIYSHTKPMNGIVTFYAHHISYRLGEITVKPFSASSINEAVAKIPANSVNNNPFTFWTDKGTVGNYEVKIPKACRELLCGADGSLVDVYGTGEYSFDKFNVKLHVARGYDNNVEIRYGKNLVDLTDEMDYSNTYNAVVPYWFGSGASEEGNNEVLVTLPEWAISSGHSSYTGRIVLIPMDLSGEFQSPPTIAQLRDRATKLVKDREGWLPSQNVNVDFVALWQTEEYAEYAPLQRVRLCDTVSVYYPDLEIDAVKKKVVKVTYNTLLERYDKIELGSLSNTLVGMINADVESNVNALWAAMQNRDATIEDVINKAVKNATDLITGGLGGHVVLKQNADGQPEEILIMNTDDINTATKVWRWNLGGLGYSNTGYSGQYGTAITMDGSIVANFITTGTLNANIIKAGVLSDVNNNTTFNLSTGELNIRRGLINLGNGAFSVTDAGVLTAQSGNLGGWSISTSGLWAGSSGTSNYALLSATSGITLGTNFSVTTSGFLTAKSGRIGTFNIDSGGSLISADTTKARLYIRGDQILFLSKGQTATASMIDADMIQNEVFTADAKRSLVSLDASTININTWNMPTVSSVPNLYVSNNDRLQKSTWSPSSSKQLKKDITQNYNDELNPKNLYNIDVVQFKYNHIYKQLFNPDPEDNRPWDKERLGIIIEDLDKAYPIAIDKQDKNDPKTWTRNDVYLIPAMLKLIQDQHKEIEKLKRRME